MEREGKMGGWGSGKGEHQGCHGDKQKDQETGNEPAVRAWKGVGSK